MFLHVDLPWLVVSDPGPRTQRRRGSGAARGTSALSSWGSSGLTPGFLHHLTARPPPPSQHECPFAVLPISWSLYRQSEGTCTSLSSSRLLLTHTLALTTPPLNTASFPPTPSNNTATLSRSNNALTIRPPLLGRLTGHSRRHQKNTVPCQTQRKVCRYHNPDVSCTTRLSQPLNQVDTHDP